MASPTDQPDPTYDEVAAFLAALVEGGMVHIVLSPGSRSTPLSVCAAAQPALTQWMQLDERTAAFFALGLAKATRTPVALVCTSGTAAANYFPAIIEASRTGVPLLVVSADRPPELHGGWGANQTIDQDDLFGRYPRMFRTMAVGGTSNPVAAAAAAREALQAMGSPSVGPAHINWPFRKPLEPVGPVPIVAAQNDPNEPADASFTRDPVVDARLASLSAHRGVIVAGPLDDPQWSSALAEFAEALGWPILAESTSQLRLLAPSANSVACSERFLLEPDIAEALVPEVVLFAGATPTGTSALQWADSHDSTKVLLADPASPWSSSGPGVAGSGDSGSVDTGSVDTGSVEIEVLQLRPESLAAAARSTAIPHVDAEWLQQWNAIDAAASQAIADTVDHAGATGPAAVRAVAKAIPHGSHLLIANSMSVRDLDRYVDCRSGVRVHVSRGASGIDGQVATALGIAAATNEPVTLVVGDIAFLHDIGSLFAAARLGLNLTIVVINDNGGGIFSMLPIAARGADVSFDELFHTPHNTDFAFAAGIEGVSFQRLEGAESIDQLRLLVGEPAQSQGGVTMIEVVVDHGENMSIRSAIDEQLATITP